MIAGVDGCKRGWLVALASEWPVSLAPRFALAPDFGAVLDLTRDCEAVAVDMPIGLPDSGPGRDCDGLARQRLVDWAEGIAGARSRVFDVAPRPVVEAPDTGFTAFNEAHRAAAGKGISRQAYAITPKIRELDRAMSPGLQTRVVEAHPELAFALLAGRRTLASKHGPLGVLQRCELLGLTATGLDGLMRTHGLPADLAEDLIDAWACLFPAAHVARLTDLDIPDHRRLPAAPPTDARGLRMEIWF